MDTEAELFDGWSGAIEETIDEIKYEFSSEEKDEIEDFVVFIVGSGGLLEETGG